MSGNAHGEGLLQQPGSVGLHLGERLRHEASRVIEGVDRNPVWVYASSYKEEQASLWDWVAHSDSYLGC